MSRDKQIDEMAKSICHAATCEIRKNGGTCYKYCKAYIYAFRAVNAGYRKSTDAAEEIFAEIDRMCIDTFGNFNHRVFAELKKKYTVTDTNVGGKTEGEG